MSHTLNRFFQILGAGLLLAGSALAQAPLNDNFANAALLPAGLPASDSGSNVGATLEPGETHYISASPSVWWSWTATVTGSVQVDTIGSGFDTVLEVFEGATLGALTRLAGDDDSGGGFNNSLLFFDAVAGHQYWIAVDGFNGRQGRISLQLASAPRITSPRTAEASLGVPFTYQITADNNPTSYYASGLPNGLSFNSTTGVISGTPTFYTGTYTVYLYAYGSNTASGSLQLAVSDLLPVVTSSAYASGAQGDFFSYQITATKSPTQYNSTVLPAGLTLDQSTGVISGTPTDYGYFSVSISATNDAGTGNPLSLYISIESGVPVVGTAALALNSGDDFSYQVTASHHPTSFTTDGSPLPVGVVFDAATGVLSGKVRVSGFYAISIGATNSYGTSYGEIDLIVSDPVSDDFAGRVRLVGNAIHRYVSTANATKEEGEPDHASASGTGSVWWTWTAPASAQYQITVGSGAPFAVYTGNTLATLREVISNRDTGSGAPTTEVFLAVAGQRYQIALDMTDAFSSTTDFSLISLGTKATALLRVASTGGGTVTRGFLGTSFRKLGLNYTITAQPVPGYLFAGWSGSIVSAEPRVTFRMEAGISLFAQFTPSPFADLKGGYMGLITSNSESPANTTTGLFKINLTAGGAFTGTVTYANGTFPFHGVFGPDGTFTGIVVRPHQWPLTVSLAFDFENFTQTLSGTIGDDVSGSSINASRTSYDAKANPTASAGAYTMTLNAEIPSAGNGFGIARVTPAGAVRFLAILPDGSRASGGGLLLDSGQWPLYASAHGGHGSISGLVTFETIDFADFDGLVTWLRPPSRGVGPNAAGFTASLTVSGASYAVPPEGTRIMALQSVPGNLTIVASFPAGATTAEQTLQKGVTVSTTNLVTPQPAIGFDLNFDVKTGLFGGHFKHPATGARQSFGGAVRQRQDVGYGLSVSPDGFVAFVALIPTEALPPPVLTSGSDSSSSVSIRISNQTVPGSQP